MLRAKVPKLSHELFNAIFPGDNTIMAEQKSHGVHLIYMSEAAAWVLNATHWLNLLQQPMMVIISEAWGPPQFQEKRSRSEKAILGALGEFRGILGAALGIGNSILGIRNSILGMASQDLSNTKPKILGATLGAIPGIAANPPERFSFAPAFSERFFKNWGGPRAPDYMVPQLGRREQILVLDADTTGPIQ